MKNKNSVCVWFEAFRTARFLLCQSVAVEHPGLTHPLVIHLPCLSARFIISLVGFGLNWKLLFFFPPKFCSFELVYLLVSLSLSLSLSLYTHPLWVVFYLLQARILYQRSGSLKVLLSILAVPGIALFWAEISGVITGIHWSSSPSLELQPWLLLSPLATMLYLLPTSSPAPLSALGISEASRVLSSWCCSHLGSGHRSGSGSGLRSCCLLILFLQPLPLPASSWFPSVWGISC